MAKVSILIMRKNCPACDWLIKYADRDLESGLKLLPEFVYQAPCPNCGFPVNVHLKEEDGDYWTEVEIG